MFKEKSKAPNFEHKSKFNALADANIEEGV